MLVCVCVRGDIEMEFKSCLPSDTRAVHPKKRRLHTHDAVDTQVDRLVLDAEADYLTKKARGRFRASETYGANSDATI